MERHSQAGHLLQQLLCYPLASSSSFLTPRTSFFSLAPSLPPSLPSASSCLLAACCKHHHACTSSSLASLLLLFVLACCHGAPHKKHHTQHTKHKTTPTTSTAQPAQQPSSRALLVVVVCCCGWGRDAACFFVKPHNKQATPFHSSFAAPAPSSLQFVASTVCFSLELAANKGLRAMTPSRC